MKARIKLSSSDHKKVEEVCKQIIEISKKTGADRTGPIPLPTKVLRVPVRKSPSGDGKATWEHWEMRVHKRMIEIDANERTMHQLMRLQIPDGVHIEIEMLS